VQIQSIIALIYDTASSINAKFGTGTEYHLSQAIANHDNFVIEPPYFYLFRPFNKLTSRVVDSIGWGDTVTLPFVYFHVVNPQDNTTLYEEAQAAGDDFIKTFVDALDQEDLISINEYEGEGDVKYFDGYIVRKFSITATFPDDFDYCSLDQFGLNQALNSPIG